MKSSLTDPLDDDDPDDEIFPEAAQAALEGPGGIVPSIAWIGEASTAAPLRVNGFPVDVLGRIQVDDGEPVDADYSRLAPIHPYFLKPGDNAIQTTGGGGAIAIVSWNYVQGDESEELLRIPLPTSGEHRFTWASKAPGRAWSNGQKIEPTESAKGSLYAESAALHARLLALSAAAATRQPTDADSAALKKELLESTDAFVKASELRGKPYRLVDQILEAAIERALPGKPAGSLQLQGFPAEEEVELEVFTGGALARLRGANNAPLFAFTSNLADGPRGRTGTTVLAFDAWYRTNDQGGWELDALFPRTAPGVWTKFELGPYELEELFRLSNF